MSAVLRWSLGVLLLLCHGPVSCGADPRPFGIQVVDGSTGRGIPLVELETTNHVRFVTDSQGRVAIDEPDLTGQQVFFHLRSHGYEFPADGFGARGKSFSVIPGQEEQVSLRRINLAERLYRVTGSGIERDSLLLGKPTRLKQPVLNSNVFGTDSVLTAVYRGKLYWFWGDSVAPRHPIGGNFHVTGATSHLPEQGGLPADQGVDLSYFADDQGQVRPMARFPGDGPTWLCAVCVLNGEQGEEQLWASYVKVRNQLEPYRWGFARWNDEREEFESVQHFDERPILFPEPQAHTFQHRDSSGAEFLYFGNPLPFLRVPAMPQAFIDPGQYEGWSCLTPRSTPQEKHLDRDDKGDLRFTWKRETCPLSLDEENQLMKSGRLSPVESRRTLIDFETGKPVKMHHGSVYWNEFRQRWILLCTELGGENSFLGELWYAESDAVTGPWRYGRKVLTHDRMSFYNPKHHPQFDEEQGRRISFEGTYTNSFSGSADATPRYEYNQVMYRLDLSRPELNLPAPCYERESDLPGAPLNTGKITDRPHFFALERPAAGTVPVLWKDNRLTVARTVELGDDLQFYACPIAEPSAPASMVPRATTVLLYEFTEKNSGKRRYSIHTDQFPETFWDRVPICRVWPDRSLSP